MAKLLKVNNFHEIKLENINIRFQPKYYDSYIYKNHNIRFQPKYYDSYIYKNHGNTRNHDWHTFINTKYKVPEILMHGSIEEAEDFYRGQDNDVAYLVCTNEAGLHEFYAEAQLSLITYKLVYGLHKACHMEDMRILSYTIENLPEYFNMPQEYRGMMTRSLMDDVIGKLKVMGIPQEQIDSVLWYSTIDHRTDNEAFNGDIRNWRSSKQF